MDEQDTGPEAFLQRSCAGRQREGERERESPMQALGPGPCQERETASDVESSLQHWVCSCFAGHLEGVRSIHRFLGDIVVGAEEFLPGTEAVTIQE